MGRKRKVQAEQAEAEEATAAIQDPPPVNEAQSKSPGRKSTKKAATPGKTSKKAKSAANALALFSDIEGVTDLPEIEVSANRTESAEVDSEAVQEKEVGEDAPITVSVSSASAPRQLSAELRKGSVTIPFVVSNQMALSGEVPTSVRPLSSLESKVSSKIRARNDVEYRPVYPNGPSILGSGGEIAIDQCKKVYECHHCRRVYFNVYSLKMHVRQQHAAGGRKIRCPTCKFVFFKMSGLRDHLARGLCRKDKESKEGAKKKGTKDTNDSVNSISEDSNSASEKPQRLNGHIAKKIFEPLLQRAMCVVEKKDAPPKTGRKRPDPKIPMNKCEICSAAYEQRDSLRRHYKQLHPFLTKEEVKMKLKALKPPSVVFRCLVPSCQKIQPSKKQFKLHYKLSHTALYNELIDKELRDMDDSVLYECPTCGKSYYLEASYLKHREECGDIEEDGHEVEIDIDMLTDPWIEPADELTQRRRRRAGIRVPGDLPIDTSIPDTQCRYCGKLFFTIYGRIDHERKHARGEVPEPEPQESLLPETEAAEQPSTSAAGQEPETPPIKVEGPIFIRCLDCNKMFQSFEGLDRHHQAFHVNKGQSVLRSQLKA